MLVIANYAHSRHYNSDAKLITLIINYNDNNNTISVTVCMYNHLAMQLLTRSVSQLRIIPGGHRNKHLLKVC